MERSYFVDSEKGNVEPPSYTSSAQPGRNNVPRTLSIAEASRAPAESSKADAKIPVEFRTLSIHVTDTKEGKASGGKGKKGVIELSSLEWHTLSQDEVLSRLGVSPKSGLDSPMVARRLEKHGKNVISPPPKHLFQKIFFYVFGGFGSLLLVASIICFVAWKPLGNPPAPSNLALAVVLLIVIAIQAIFNAWQDFSTSRVMASIGSMLPTKTLVLRDGKFSELPVSELTYGDIVKIILGAKTPADLRLLEISPDLKFDRSMLTGESNPIPGSLDATDNNFMESRNVALQGTLCTAGSALGVCVGIGDGTVFGRIAKQSTKSRPARTTLEIEILRFVLIIASLAILVAIFIVILWAAWLRKDYPSFINVPTLLIDCVSVAVAFIPEGLPVCVTLSLTVIAGAMRKSNVLCKSLSTVESLGSVSVICSDKTGTLTQNRMSVVNVALGNSESRLTITEARERAVITDSEKGGETGEVVRSLAAVAALCNDAMFEDMKLDMPVEMRKVNGDATDSGMLRFAESIHSVEEYRGLWDEVGKIAFNSKNKFALKLFKPMQGSSSRPLPLLTGDVLNEKDHVLLVKGAPDILLRRCTRFVSFTGDVLPLSSQDVARISAAQNDLASRGQRVLLLAKKIVPSHDFDRKDLEDASRLEDVLLALNDDLVVVGLVGMVDPPRDDTVETVRICRGAGIRFAMVTGDFALTAVSIAEQVGIITNPVHAVKHFSDLPYDTPMDQIPPFDDKKEKGDPVTSLVLSGSEMTTMTESQWKQVMTFDELVFARTSPQQKLQIVKMFQSEGCTVAVTGDGVNDAPALKQADVGVAVGGGSEVAMEAADLILLDRFSAIVTGIEYGRLCFENLRKTILYLLPAGSFSELMPVLANVLFGLPQALSNIQMILICVVTDVLPALSLVFEKPEADLLERRPRNRKTDRLASIRLLCHAYLFIGVIESVTSFFSTFYFGFVQKNVPFSLLWLNYGGNTPPDPNTFNELLYRANSIYFFNLVIMQWFNLLSTRTRRLSIFQHNPFGGPKTRNLYLVPAMLGALCLGCFFSYIPFFQQIFLDRGIPVQLFFLPMAFGTVILFLDEMRKWWNRTHPKSLLARIAW